MSPKEEPFTIAETYYRLDALPGTQPTASKHLKGMANRETNQQS